MDDASHLLQYRRFFGTLFSVLPGLELTYALSALVLWVLGDIVLMEFGWALGLGAITFVLTFVIWLFVGMGIQKWVEDKSGTFLFVLNLPFLLIFFGFMGWLFVETVLGAEPVGGPSHSAVIQPLLQMLG
jgi:hypothetical protein